jgi:methyl-accepting chemotaxis protein
MNLKLRTKITLAFSLIAIISIVMLGWVTTSIGKKTMESEVFDKLTAIRELKANHVETYFEDIRNQLLSFSEDYMIKEATRDFSRAYAEIAKAENDSDYFAFDTQLQQFYSKQFLPKLNSNSHDSNSLLEYYPSKLSARMLQSVYVMDFPQESVVNRRDVQEYMAVHSKFPHT